MYFMSNSTVIVVFSPVASRRMVLLIIYTFLINMWEKTLRIIRSHTHFQCWCVSCDDIVKPCSLRRSQESDLQMRSSWTSEMKYSSVLIRGRTLAEHWTLSAIFSQAETRQCISCSHMTLYTHKQMAGLLWFSYLLLSWPLIQTTDGSFFFRVCSLCHLEISTERARFPL